MSADPHHTARLQEWLDRVRADEDHDGTLRGELIRHASSRLEALTRRMLRRNPRLARWEQTDDVMQNALIRLHRALETVKPESPGQFYGLAATQIRRELIDLARHHLGPLGAGRKHQTGGAGKAADDPGGPIPMQGRQGGEPTDLEGWTEFHQAIERLPVAERTVIDLLWYHNMSQAEAAEIMGVTTRTIKNRWRSAKLLLQEMLAEQQPE